MHVLCLDWFTNAWLQYVESKFMVALQEKTVAVEPPPTTRRNMPKQTRMPTLDQRRLVEKHQWLEVQQPWRRKRRERARRRQVAKMARASLLLSYTQYAARQEPTTCDTTGVMVQEPTISDIGGHAQGAEPFHDAAMDVACDPEPGSGLWSAHTKFLDNK